MFKKIARWTALIFFLAFVGIQFVRPDRTNPEFDRGKDLAGTADLDSTCVSIFRRSCYDCHSMETRWPWYSNIAPVSWLLANDVHTGRRHLNFSIWGKYAKTRRLKSLDDIRDELSSGDMPLPQYLLIHAEARLSPAEKDSLLVWTVREKHRLESE